jgi:hypothetical protein
MHEPTYSVALAAAAVVDEFFTRHPSAASAIPCPDPATVASIVDAAFWASLRQEEGRSPRISLAFVVPEEAGHAITFAQPIPLAPESLTRLAPAVERPGVHLAVSRRGDELLVWGATRTLPELCLVFEVVEPGLLVIKYRRGAEFEKFGNIAVLRGDQLGVVDDRTAPPPEGSPLLQALLGLESTDCPSDTGAVFVQLAVSMRGHGRGGLLLVVPSDTTAWRDSIVQPVGYAIAPPFSRLAELLRRPKRELRRTGVWDEVRRLVDVLAGLTAVDGAAIMTDHYDLLAFGATIGRREGHGAVEQVVVTEPLVGNLPAIVAPTQLGGTRHLAAAQFVHDQRDSLALVASQDGRFTVCAWSRSEAMVHAYRIEALLF